MAQRMKHGLLYPGSGASIWGVWGPFFPTENCSAGGGGSWPGNEPAIPPFNQKPQQQKSPTWWTSQTSWPGKISQALCGGSFWKWIETLFLIKVAICPHEFSVPWCANGGLCFVPSLPLFLLLISSPSEGQFTKLVLMEIYPTQIIMKCKIIP